MEHLDDRHSQERGKHPGEQRIVLACWECNNRRSRLMEKIQPLELLQRRAGNYRDQVERPAL